MVVRKGFIAALLLQGYVHAADVEVTNTATADAVGFSPVVYGELAIKAETKKPGGKGKAKTQDVRNAKVGLKFFDGLVDTALEFKGTGTEGASGGDLVLKVGKSVFSNDYFTVSPSGSAKIHAKKGYGLSFELNNEAKYLINSDIGDTTFKASLKPSVSAELDSADLSDVVVSDDKTAQALKAKLVTKEDDAYKITKKKDPAYTVGWSIGADQTVSAVDGLSVGANLSNTLSFNPIYEIVGEKDDLSIKRSKYERELASETSLKVAYKLNKSLEVSNNFKVKFADFYRNLDSDEAFVNEVGIKATF